MRAIGVDLGGTKLAVAALNDGALGDSVVEPTDLSGSEALIAQVCSLVEQVRGSGPLDAVGVGVPSVVAFDAGRIVSSVNVPLKDVPLRHVLSERLGVPAFVDNDATVAALAEAHDDQLRLVARDLVMITVGTGVGGGIVIDGRIYRGATGGTRAGQARRAVSGCAPRVGARPVARGGEGGARRRRGTGRPRRRSIGAENGRDMG
jgi:glucokinase